MQQVALVLCVLAVVGLATTATPVDRNFDEFELRKAMFQEYMDKYADTLRDEE